MNPPTPSFPMELKKTEVGMSSNHSNSDVAKFLDDKMHNYNLKNPIFIDSNNTNSRAIAENEPFCLLRPHNCRRQIHLLNGYNSYAKKDVLAIKNSKQNHHTKVITIKNYMGSNVTIQLSKKYITAMWNQKVIKGRFKETYKISGTKKDISIFLDLKFKEIAHKLDYFLNSLITNYNIATNEKSVCWGQIDIWLRSSADKLNLPKECIIDTSSFSKVYNEGIEVRLAHGEDTSKIINHINNSKLIDLEPDLVTEMERIHNKIDNIKEFLNPLRYLKEHITSAVDLLQYVDVIKLLTRTELKEISKYTFNLELENE